MRIEHLLEHIKYHDDNPYSQPLFVDAHGRILRFTLKAGQSITEHNAPHSPFYLIVLQGQGLFSGGDGKEQEFGPNTLLICDAAENHAIHAPHDNLVFVGFLQGVPTARSGNIGGEIGREEASSTKP